MIIYTIYYIVKVIESVLEPIDFNFTKTVANSIKNIIFCGPYNEKTTYCKWWLRFMNYPFKKLKSDFILTSNPTNFKLNLTNLVCFVSIKQKPLQFVMDLSVMSIQLHPINLKFTWNIKNIISLIYFVFFVFIFFFYSATSHCYGMWP